MNPAQQEERSRVPTLAEMLGKMRRAFSRTYPTCNRVRHPCGCARGCECPDCGCGQAKAPKRLPVIGESPLDVVAKEAWRSSSFGHWLNASDDRVGAFSDLIRFIDAVEDPYRTTLSSVAARLRAPIEDIDSEFGDADGLLAEFSDASARFLDEVVGTTSTHDCVLYVLPIIPWPKVSGVYFARAGERVKIGKARDVAARLRELQTSAPFKLELMAVMPGSFEEERAVHDRFKHLRVVGEWFELRDDLLTFIFGVREHGRELLGDDAPLAAAAARDPRRVACEILSALVADDRGAT